MIRTPAIIILLSLGTATAMGCNSTKRSPASSSTGAAQRVEIIVDGQGYHPDHIDAHGGSPLTLVFRRVTDQTCGTEIAVPSQHIKKSLPLNQPVEVALNADSAGEIRFSCGMGMLKGAVVVQ